MSLNVGMGSAAVVTFFGEDVNLSGDPTVATPLNASAASGRFFANLSNSGTETFEGFNTGTFVPLTATFSGMNSAVISGTGTVVSGNDGGGRFPISGTQYLLTSVEGGVNLRFSSPVSAFGFYATDIGDFGGQLMLTLTDTSGNLTTLTAPNTMGTNGSTSGSVLYYAFYDRANSYTNISISTSVTDTYAFDNLTVGTLLQPAPEPGDFALMGFGAIALYTIGRFRRNR